jgi:hypothetical protein
VVLHGGADRRGPVVPGFAATLRPPGTS